jgi:hypothetical protein
MMQSARTTVRRAVIGKTSLVGEDGYEKSFLERGRYSRLPEATLSEIMPYHESR